MKILYFAWLREKIGTSGEDLPVPEDVRTVRELIRWLQSRGPGYAAEHANAAPVRCAVDQDFAGLDAPLGPAREIAFFPPVTGG